MGCGSSSQACGEFDMLEVIFKFPCKSIITLHAQQDHPLLVVGRITGVTTPITSPYSCQECALYRINCYIRKKDQNNVIEKGCRKWEKIYSEVRAATFCLRDPDDEAAKVVRVPGKILTVKFFQTEMTEEFCEENSVELSECTPSISALLKRSGLKEYNLHDIRIQEWVVEENSKIGVFGLVYPGEDSSCDDRNMTMKPLQVKGNRSEKYRLNKRDESRYCSLAVGDRSIIVIEDPKFFQGLKVRPFTGNLPDGRSSCDSRKETSSLSLDDVSADIVTSLPKIVRKPAAGETHVLIPPGAVPGTKITVPGPRGSHLVTIPVPLDFKAGDIHILKEDF